MDWLKVRVGSNKNTGGEELDIAEIIIHENYVDADQGYDIALLKTEEPIPDYNENKDISAICLPKHNFDLSRFEGDDNKDCVVAGWGVISWFLTY